LVKSPQIQQQKEEEGQHHSVANEELNEELILHCWRLVQEQVRRVIELIDRKASQIQTSMSATIMPMEQLSLCLSSKELDG
jgi:hypothetical protein